MNVETPQSGYEDLHGTTPTVEYKKLLNEHLRLKQEKADVERRYEALKIYYDVCQLELVKTQNILARIEQAVTLQSSNHAN